MARNRTIKPEFFTSDQVVDCSTTARLLFVGLWCFSDDRGVHPASARRAKMEVFPADDHITTEDVARMVEELKAAGLLGEFVGDDSKTYWYSTGWKKHQRIEKPNYKHPEPPEENDDSPTSRRPVDDQSTTPHPRNGMESKGMESKGVESKGKESKGTPFKPPQGADTSEAIGPASPDVNSGTGSSGSACDPIREAEFEKFWSAYPPRQGRKVGKAEARIAFAKVKASEVEDLIRAAGNYAEHCRTKDGFPKDAKRFISSGRGSKVEPWREWVEVEEVEVSRLTPAKDWKKQKYCPG